MLLCVIETFIEWPLSIGELLETCRCVTERICTLLQPLNRIGRWLFMLMHRPSLCTINASPTDPQPLRDLNCSNAFVMQALNLRRFGSCCRSSPLVLPFGL